MNTYTVDDIENHLLLYNRTITRIKTFYIYKYDDKLSLTIVDGVQTNPPFSPTISKYDPDRYSKVFTIPKGILNKYHSSWITDEICGILFKDKFVILTERNDYKARKLFKQKAI